MRLMVSVTAVRKKKKKKREIQNWECRKQTNTQQPLHSIPVRKSVRSNSAEKHTTHEPGYLRSSSTYRWS